MHTPRYVKKGRGDYEKQFFHANTRCYHCDGTHKPESCMFKNSKCRYCDKVGHIVKCCRSKLTAQQSNRFASKMDSGQKQLQYKSTHYMTADEPDQEQTDTYSMFRVRL